MKIISLICFFLLTSANAFATGYEYFISCTAEQGRQVTMSFEPGGRYFTYVLHEEGVPRGFLAMPERGWGFDHSSVTYGWTGNGELKFKARIMGGNQLRPKFLYSADVTLKDVGPQTLKIMNIEVFYNERPQNLLLFQGQFCKVSQGFPY